MHQLVPGPPIAEPPQPVPRIVVVYDDPELVDVLTELFGPTARVSPMGQVTSVNPIADREPDLMIIGSPAGRNALGAWQIVTLARAHRRLRDVPIIVLTSDIMATLCDGRLAGCADLHLVEMPFDVEVIRRVVGTAMASIDARRFVSVAAAVPVRAAI
jgi:CheY-like chemotaxis protein